MHSEHYCTSMQLSDLSARPLSNEKIEYICLYPYILYQIYAKMKAIESEQSNGVKKLSSDTLARLYCINSNTVRPRRSSLYSIPSMKKNNTDMVENFKNPMARRNKIRKESVELYNDKKLNANAKPFLPQYLRLATVSDTPDTSDVQKEKQKKKKKNYKKTPKETEPAKPVVEGEKATKPEEGASGTQEKKKRNNRNKKGKKTNPEAETAVAQEKTETVPTEKAQSAPKKKRNRKYRKNKNAAPNEQDNNATVNSKDVEVTVTTEIEYNAAATPLDRPIEA